MRTILTGYSRIVSHICRAGTGRRTVVRAFHACACLSTCKELGIITSARIPFRTEEVLTRTLSVPGDGMHIVGPEVNKKFNTGRAMITRICPTLIA